MPVVSLYFEKDHKPAEIFHFGQLTPDQVHRLEDGIRELMKNGALD